MEDGDILAIAMKRSAVTVNFTAPGACNVDHTGTLNITGKTGQQPGSQQQQQQRMLGCQPWTPDPSGQFVHSGDNRRFGALLSTLTLSAYFVQDGHVAFRYAVDAEPGFDGFSFEMDWAGVIPRKSTTAGYKDVLVNVSRGHHTLRWQYTKDFTNAAGQDRAWIQFIEVAGTDHADMDCWPCRSSTTHSTAGAARCNACGRNSFLVLDRSTVNDLARCAACPTGRWSPSGSEGNESCRERLPCEGHDVEASYTVCSQNSRFRRWTWRDPLICDPAHPDSVKLDTESVKADCEPCHANEMRPDGGPCRPRVRECLPTQFAVQEARIEHWNSWPRNFSHEFTALQPGGQSSHAEHSGWRLALGGQFAFASDDALERGSKARAGLALGEDLLHMDVQIYSSAGRAGEVRFLSEVRPLEAWGQEAHFLIDGVPVADLQVTVRPNRRLEVVSPLAEGAHRLTWSWQRHALPTTTRGDQNSESPDAVGSTGFLLLNVTVLHADGAGSPACLECPPGHEVLQGGLRCNPCPAGTASRTSAIRCKPCPANYFSGPASSTCLPCGKGLSSPENASSCQLDQEVTAKDIVEGADPAVAAGDPVRFSLAAISDSWQAAVGQVKGAFTVSGREYILSPFASSSAPGGGEGKTAYVWEVEPPEGLLADSSAAQGECRGTSMQSWALALGSTFMAAEPLATPELRGVRLSYRSAEICRATGEPRWVSLLFRCDPAATMPATARQDEFGAIHLPGLHYQRMVARRGQSDECANVSLAWSTAAACPPCRHADHAPQMGICEDDGYQLVSFTLMRPCLGGAELPQSRREPCKVGSVRHATIYFKMLISGASLLGCTLCGYACYLHRKYAEYERNSL